MQPEKINQDVDSSDETSSLDSSDQSDLDIGTSTIKKKFHKMYSETIQIENAMKR